MTDKETRNTRYRNSICIECGTTKHSAGRPRCNHCHNLAFPILAIQASRENYPCRNCGNETRMGSVICQSCLYRKKAEARK